MITPYPYQYECLDCIAQHRAHGAPVGLVVMAMGLGKTVVAAFDAKRHFAAGGGRLLYLCHMTDILYQARSEFEAIVDGEKSFGFLIGREKALREVDCLFATFETMMNWLDLFASNEFDYIVVDESHHSHAETYFRTLTYFKPKFLLGLTGTPERLDRKDIKSIYGEPIFNLPLEEALGKNYLTPVDYRILTDEVSLEEIITDPNRRWSEQMLNRSIFIPKRDEEIAHIIERETKSIKDPKTIVFCPSVKYCNHLTKFLPDSLTIHSHIPDKEREVRLEMFRQDMLDTVLTVNCFNEGIDIPRANVLVFLRSTVSKAVFLQQLGRGLRKSVGKDKVVALDFVGNLRRIRHIKELVRSAEEFMTPRTVAGNGTSDVTPPIMLEVGMMHFKEECVSFTELLGRVLRQEPYPTWQEAGAAAIAVGATTQVHYRVVYKKDPRLPGDIERRYADFPGWRIFLGGKEYYPTWQEASVAALKLKVTNSINYTDLHLKDPRLPGNPWSRYKNFPGWHRFLKRKPAPKKFRTWQQASAALKGKALRSRSAYKYAYKKISPRLPRHPDRFYQDFPGWGIFLQHPQKKFYTTYRKAARAARKLGIKSSVEYLKRGGYKRDPLLSAMPEQKYRKDWKGWNKFLGTSTPRLHYPTWQEASRVARTLKCATIHDYYRRCKSLDPLLPVAADMVYKDFPGWKTYLGKE